MTQAGQGTSVGATLKSAREARGITLRALADRTKISTRCFEAIERDDVTRLPAGIFARSFVKAYATEVGLDPDGTVQAFFAQFAPPEPPPEAVPEPPPARRLFGEFDPAELARAAAVVLPVVLLVLWGAWGWTRTDGPAPIAAAPIAAVSYDAPALSPARHADDLVDGDDVVPAGGAIEGSLTLRIVASDSCWVSASADGRTVYRQLMASGDEMTVDASSELQVRVGDAGAVTMFLNGERVRSLGEPGDVVAVRIDQQNLHEFSTSLPLMH